MNLILTLFCAGLISVTYCVDIPDNPCPSVFQYKQEMGVIFGEIYVPADGTGNFELQVNVSMRGYYRNQNIQLKLLSSVDELYSGSDPKYRVNFPFQNVLPKITQIMFNKRVFCSGPPEPLNPGSSVTSMWSKTSLELNPGGNNPHFKPITQTSRYTEATTSTTTKRRKTTITSTTYPSTTLGFEHLLDVRIGSSCGSANDVQSLKVRGDTDKYNEFPWLAALMYRKKFTYEFRCTSNLISNRHIVTAAHCIQLFRVPLIPREDILIVLGKYNIQNWANGKAELRDAEKVMVHPSYEQKGSYDLAVIKLNQPVEFSNSIRPICLWNGPTDLESIQNTPGTVVGWGKDEKGEDMVAEPRKISLPVVSQEICLKSNINLTSDFTFCAGNLDENRPCAGDSGAGFMMQNNSKWLLRGVVSVATRDPVTKYCDNSKYFIFTDVGKLNDWVKNVMKQ